MTLVELMIAMGIFSVVSGALMTIFIFSLRSFESIANYTSLDRDNRVAVDKLTQDIRTANYVGDYSTNPLALTLVLGSTKVTYSYDAVAKTLIRATSGGDKQVLLDNCSDVTINLFQRNAVGGSYDVFPVANGNWQTTAKVVEVSWRTTRTIGGTKRTNSEYVQTARIVIRKQTG